MFIEKAFILFYLYVLTFYLQYYSETVMLQSSGYSGRAFAAVDKKAPRR